MKIESDIRKITDCLTEWLVTVHPDRTPDQVLTKLIEELEELKARPCDGHEIADVGILFFDYARLVGIDLPIVMHWKHEINKNRKWKMTEGGILQHIEE